MVGGGVKLWSHGGECSNKGAEGKAERFSHRGTLSTSTQQPEIIVCSAAGAGEGWELRPWIRNSDLRERTEIGCMNTT